MEGEKARRKGRKGGGRFRGNGGGGGGDGHKEMS